MTAKNCPAWTVRTMYLNLPKVWATSPPILYCAFHVVGLLTQMSAEMSSQKQFLDADHCLNIRRCVIVNRWLGNNLFWHRNGSNLTGILFAGRVPDTPNVCQSWQSLKTKVFIIPGAWSQTCFGATSWERSPASDSFHREAEPGL